MVVTIHRAGNEDRTTPSTSPRLLQDRLNALNDLALTLKHVHWNVVGPNFIAVHTMLDPQVDAARVMVDATAERIATLGGSPRGTPGALVAQRTWTTTPSAAPAPWSIWRPGRGVRGHHRGAARGYRDDRGAGSRSRRTCSSSIPASWSSSTGSSVPTWRTPTARSSPAAPGQRRGRLGRLARARRASVPESAEAAPVFARSAAPGGPATGLSPIARCRGREEVDSDNGVATRDGSSGPRPGSAVNTANRPEAKSVVASIGTAGAITTGPLVYPPWDSAWLGTRRSSRLSN